MNKTVSSRDFNQDVSGVKRSAASGPVFITDRGKPAHVLMTIEDYRRLAGAQKTIVELLGQDDGGEIEFEAPKLDGRLFHPADLS